ncbi:MAG TPA: site-2 protease family protein [Fimbriimonadales bacterium]|nr:site-2 protease family protein [Fimbriimonadales bacterium]
MDIRPDPHREEREVPNTSEGGAFSEHEIVGGARETEQPKSHVWQWLSGIGVVLAFLLAKGKALLPVLKFLKLGKILPTAGSMLLSVWFYAMAFGFWFALGFVLSIFVHEMGHVFAAWRKGVPVTPPVFIPGMGAFILQKRAAKSAWDEAIIGIGGPIGGAIAALFCLGLYYLTDSLLMLGLAYTGFLINLFNLAPIFPLDGGWIVGAISPRLWLVGTVLLAVLFFVGFIRNPFILLLLILSIPRLIHGLKSGEMLYPEEKKEPTTKEQKWILGFAYLVLVVFLAVLVAETHLEPGEIRR